MIDIRDSGLVYRNPRPELRSRHTWHPTIVRFPDGELLVTFDIAEADVALDYRTYATHSTDAGVSWTAPERVVPDPAGRPTTQSVRTAAVPDGSVVAMGALMYRDDPELSVVNVPTLGYTEMELILTRSRDRGRTWSGIERIDPPLVGPAFEVCHAIVPLRDGRWVWPCSTWMGWDGDAPNGMNAILLVSEDEGRTWPSFITEFGSSPTTGGGCGGATARCCAAGCCTCRRSAPSWPSTPSGARCRSGRLWRRHGWRCRS